MPAFRCGGMWPRSAQNWPRMENSTWPQQQVVTQIKVKGSVIRLKYNLLIIRMMDFRWFQKTE